MENEALKAKEKYQSSVESAYDYIERFDLLETITNVGNDEVFTPRNTCNMLLDRLPEEVWHNPNYKWLNPATKNGIFEREIAIRLDEGLKDIIPDEETRRKHILQNMIYAIGQTKFTSNVTRRTLYYCSEANRKCDGIKAEDGHYVNGFAIGNGSWFNDAEGNIHTPKTEHWYESSCKKCKFCGIDKDSKYNDELQREHYAYEFIHYERQDLLWHFIDDFFKGDKSMKFDIIIGNPPYQLSVNESGKGLSAKPIYNLFVEQAIELKPKYLSMIIPSRWFTGGVGLNGFREKILHDKRIREITDYVDSKECFPNVDINGGVCYFLWDRDYNGNCLYTSISKKTKCSKYRNLDQFDIFIRNNNSLSIIEKVLKSSFKTLNESGGCSPQTPYGFLSTFVGNSKRKNESDCEILTSKGWAFVEKDKIEKGLDSVYLYKAMISKLTCEHAGTPDKEGKYRVLSRTEILKPSQICSQSYLVICPQKNEELAKNVMSYLKTKFVRFLMQMTLTGMNISTDNFRFVPWLDFSQPYDDDQLYKMFNLTQEEINEIEFTIREMD